MKQGEGEDSKEELVLMLNEPEKKTESSDEDQLVDEKLSHLNTQDAEAVKKIIRDYPELIANSFENVRPSAVSVTHRFELTSEKSTYQKERSMSPFHNDIIRKEIDRMLAAGIINTVESPWNSFSTLKNNGLRLRIKKCSFMQTRVELLRNIVDINGVHVDDHKGRMWETRHRLLPERNFDRS